MERHVIIQAGSAMISIILVVVFYLVLMLGMLSSKDVLLHLIMIILTIVSLAIFSEISKIEYNLRRGKK